MIGQVAENVQQRTSAGPQCKGPNYTMRVCEGALFFLADRKTAQSPDFTNYDNVEGRSNYDNLLQKLNTYLLLTSLQLVLLFQYLFRCSWLAATRKV